MKRSQSAEKQFTRRAVVFGGVQAVGIGVLLARLSYLQFVRNDEFRDLAEGNRVKLQLIPPERGKLLDRAGVELAANHTNYRMMLSRDAPKQSLKTLQQLEHILPKEAARWREVASTIERLPRPPLLLKEHVSWDEVSILEFHRMELPELFIEEGWVRAYPLVAQASHLIGYVGKVAESERDNTQPLLRLPDYKIGKSGCELMLEERLRGKAGTRHLEVNVTGLTVRELQHRNPVAGEEIRLTIDARMQRFCAERLGEESGSIALLNAQTGEVLALAAMPSFDPNEFSVGIKTGYWKELNANKKTPLLNKVIAGQYPPGSTYKMMVGLAGLRAGIINEHSRVHCPGHFYLGNHRFRCWKPGGHGSMNLASAIAQSCDTYFYSTADRLGIERIAEMSREFGLGAITGIGLPNEKPGIMPDPEWKKKRYNQRWTGGDTVNVGIGQGYVLATPLQLALMTARLCNGGKQVVPTLLPVPENATFPMIDIEPRYLEATLEGMDMVCNHPTGTAFGKRIADPAMMMGGKTGTSQVRRIIQHGLDQSKLPWEHRHHALFVGYAPVASPKYAVGVMIEHGGGGASAAAPVARDVLEKMQQLDAEDNAA